MNCMKCGRETLSEQIFCENCLQEMEKYPVKPGIAVKLPERRETTSFRRAPKRRTVNPEEQVKVLKWRTTRLAILLFIAVILILLMLPAALSHILDSRRKPGQNYSVATSSTPVETTTAAP